MPQKWHNFTSLYLLFNYVIYLCNLKHERDLNEYNLRVIFKVYHYQTQLLRQCILAFPSINEEINAAVLASK